MGRKGFQLPVVWLPLSVLVGVNGLTGVPTANAWEELRTKDAVSGGSQALSSAPWRADPVPDCPLPGIDTRCEEWAAVYDDPEMYEGQASGSVSGARDILVDMVMSPKGDLVFTHGITEHGIRDIYGTGQPFSVIVATRVATGEQLWTARSQGGQLFADIAVSRDAKRVYATGMRGAFERPADDVLWNTNVLTIAYDAATGEKLWEEEFGGAPKGHRDDEEGEEYDLHSRDAGSAVAANPEKDELYVAGFGDSVNGDSGNFYDMLIVAYRGATGARLWVSSYDHPIHPYSDDRALTYLARVSPDGETLYVGVKACDGEGGGECDYLLSAFRVDGAPGDDGAHLPLWVADVGAAPSAHEVSTPSALEVSSNGERIYMTGFIDPESGNYASVAIDATTGERLWLSEYGDEVTASGLGRPVSVASSPGGDEADDVYVTGSQTGDGVPGYVTVAYDGASGEELWTARMSLPTHNVARAGGIDVSPAGDRVYVTGRHDSGCNIGVSDSIAVYGEGRCGWLEPSQTTVAYDARTGDQLWIARFNRLTWDEATGEGVSAHVEVTPQGAVLTAGQQEGISYDIPISPDGNFTDWGIQKYEP